MMEVFSFRVQGHCNTSKKKCEIDRFKDSHGAGHAANGQLRRAQLEWRRQYNLFYLKFHHLNEDTVIKSILTY